MEERAITKTLATSADSVIWHSFYLWWAILVQRWRQKMTIVIPIRICIKKIKEWNNFFSNFKKFCRSLYFFLHILISFKSIVLRHFETKMSICAFSIESLPYRNSNRISPNKQRMTSMDFIKSGVCLRLGPKKTFGNEHKDPNHLPMSRIWLSGKIFTYQLKSNDDFWIMTYFWMNFQHILGNVKQWYPERKIHKDIVLLFF